MPVRDNDPANRLPLPPPPPQRPPQEQTPADESCIQQIKTRRVSKDVKVDRRCADLEDISGQGGVR